MTTSDHTSPVLPDNKVGWELIMAERMRQVSEEGWTVGHDQRHSDGQMAKAALCYMATAKCQLDGLPSDWWDTPSLSWPWLSHWWNPSDDPVRNLVKAGALIAAEIDRIQHMEGS